MSHDKMICEGKESFDSYDQAMSRNKNIKNRKKKSTRRGIKAFKLNVYKCDICGKYHLTKQRKK